MELDHERSKQLMIDLHLLLYKDKLLESVSQSKAEGHDLDGSSHTSDVDGSVKFSSLHPGILHHSGSQPSSSVN